MISFSTAFPPTARFALTSTLIVPYGENLNFLRISTKQIKNKITQNSRSHFNISQALNQRRNFKTMKFPNRHVTRSCVAYSPLPLII